MPGGSSLRARAEFLGASVAAAVSAASALVFAGDTPAATAAARTFQHVLRRDEVDAVGVDFDDLRASGVEPVDHLLQQLAADLRDARGGVEIGEVALRESEVAVEAVDQDFEGVLEGVKVLLLGAIARRAHGGFCFQPKLPQIGEEAAEDRSWSVTGKTSNCSMTLG